MPKLTTRERRQKEGRILDSNSYSKYNGMGGSNTLISYFRCCMCKGVSPNIASMEEGIEFGVFEFADLLWCSGHYWEQMEFFYK